MKHYKTQNDLRNYPRNITYSTRRKRKRQAAEIELGHMEEDLKNKLLELTQITSEQTYSTSLGQKSKVIFVPGSFTLEYCISAIMIQ